MLLEDAGATVYYNDLEKGCLKGLMFICYVTGYIVLTAPSKFRHPTKLEAPAPPHKKKALTLFKRIQLSVYINPGSVLKADAFHFPAIVRTQAARAPRSPQLFGFCPLKI